MSPSFEGYHCIEKNNAELIFTSCVRNATISSSRYICIHVLLLMSNHVYIVYEHIYWMYKIASTNLEVMLNKNVH